MNTLTDTTRVRRRRPQGGVFATVAGERVWVESFHSLAGWALVRKPGFGPKRKVPLDQVDFGTLD